MSTQPPRSGGLSPIPQLLRHQNSQSSLQSTTTYHSIHTSMPSPVRPRSSLHYTGGRSSPKLPPSRSSTPQAENMIRKDSGYADGRRSPVKRISTPPVRTGAPTTLPIRTSTPPIRTTSPTSMQGTISSEMKATTVPGAASMATRPRPKPLRPSSVTAEPSASSSKRSTSSRRVTASPVQNQSESESASISQRPPALRRQSRGINTTPSSPTVGTSSETDHSTAPSRVTSPRHSRRPSTQSHSRQQFTSTPQSRPSSRPRPERASTGGAGRVSRPGSQRRHNTSPVLSHNLAGAPSREVPFQYFQFPTLEDDHLSTIYPSPPGTAHRPNTGRRSRKGTASSTIRPLGITGLDDADDCVVGERVGKVGSRTPPATVNYWTSPETRRKEYAAIDAASKGMKGFCLRVLPDCFVPEVYRVTPLSERDADGDGGEELQKRGRGSIGGKAGKRGRGDEGSVRRYRISLDDDRGSEASNKSSENSEKQGNRKKKWFSWGKA